MQRSEVDVNDVSGRPTKEQLEEALDALRSLNDIPKGTGVDSGK